MLHLMIRRPVLPPQALPLRRMTMTAVTIEPPISYMSFVPRLGAMIGACYGRFLERVQFGANGAMSRVRVPIWVHLANSLVRG